LSCQINYFRRPVVRRECVSLVFGMLSQEVKVRFADVCFFGVRLSSRLAYVLQLYAGRDFYH